MREYIIVNSEQMKIKKKNISRKTRIKNNGTEKVLDESTKSEVWVTGNMPGKVWLGFNKMVIQTSVEFII